MIALHDGAAGDVQPSAEDIEFASLHLCYLRLTNPDLTMVGQYQAWEPNTMLLGLVDNAPTTDYEALKLQYGVVSDEDMGFYHLVTFSEDYNILALSAEFAALAEVEYAEPNSLVGGQHDRYEYQGLGGGVWQWVVYDEFHDCFDGCDCAKIWSYEVDEPAGLVDELSYVEEGQEWCVF